MFSVFRQLKATGGPLLLLALLLVLLPARPGHAGGVADPVAVLGTQRMLVIMVTFPAANRSCRRNASPKKRPAPVLTSKKYQAGWPGWRRPSPVRTNCPRRSKNTASIPTTPWSTEPVSTASSATR